MQKSTNTHRSVERALGILMAFTPSNREMGIVEVSERVGLHRSTVNRLMRVLTHHGFLRQDPGTKKYSLGSSAVEIGRSVTQSLDSRLITIAQPHIDALCNSVGESVGLEVMSGNSTIYAYRARGPRLAQVSFNLGDRLPIHVAAGAKAVLAFLSPEVIKNILPKKLTRFTPNTITDRKVLIKQLVEIRKQGVSFDRGERDIDVHVIAAPIFNHKKRPVAAIVIPVPVSRKEFLMTPHVISQLKDTATEISSRLFYSEEDK